MKKLLLTLMLMFVVGCSNNTVTKDNKVISILSPQGATAIAVMGIQSDQTLVEYVAGTDVIQAALVSPDSKYDMIVAPSNLGAKLASANKSEYKMIGVITWGNLYIVGNPNVEMNSDATIALFGDQAVPGLVYEMVQDYDMQSTYYNAVNEAQAQLLAGNVDFAMLAEPAVTATLMKNENLQVVADLQALYEEKFGSYGFPQAAIFVKADVYNANKAQFDDILLQIASNIELYAADSSLLQQKIDEITPEVLGVPSSKIIAKAYAALNLKYAKASDVKEQLEQFLSNFNITDVNSYIID